MKKFKLFKLLALFVVLITSINQVWADHTYATWIGKSYITVGPSGSYTWYNAEGTGQSAGAFNGHEFGIITSLYLGGQVQTYGQSDGASNPATLHYKFDDGADNTISLPWFQYSDNNNWFQSHGNEIDITGLSAGEHSLKVWFEQEDGIVESTPTSIYDNNGGSNYVATFVIEEAYDVTVSYKCGTATILEDDEESAVGVSTARDVTAPDIDGYTFSSWTVGSGITNNTGSTTAGTININTISSGSYTLTANYTANDCSLYKVSAAKDGDLTEVGAMTFDPTTKAYYRDVTTNSSPYYFRFNFNSGTYYSSDWTSKEGGDAYSTGKTVTANGDKVECAQDVTSWGNKPSIVFSGLNGSAIRVWFDYQSKQTWITEETFTVTIHNGNHGEVSPSGEQAAGPNSGVSITATPYSGYRFTSWTKTGENVTLSSTTTNPTTVTATGTGTVTANYAQRYILRGSTSNHSVTGGMAGWLAENNDDYTSFSVSGTTMTVKATLFATTTYDFNLYDMQGTAWKGQTGSGSISASTQWTLDGTNNISFTTTQAGVYIFTFGLSGSNPTVEITYPDQYLVGDFNSWDTDETPFDEDGKVIVTLEAGTQKFKVIKSGTWYGKTDFSITTSSVVDQTLTSGGGDEKNGTITVPSGGGDYTFGWDAVNNKVSVFIPADKDKVMLTKSKYIYFDARGLATTGDGWRKGDFTARFWFKNFATAEDVGHVDCTKANALEGWVYYAEVPDDDAIGRVQLNRIVDDVATCAANVVHAYSRTSASQNCLTKETDKEGFCINWDPQWTTYCPPKATSTIADNNTVKYTIDGAEDGSVEHPFLVEAGGTIKVSASSTNYINDANMQTKYNFYVDETSRQDGTGTTLDYTASASAGETHAIKVNSYNYYNSTSSTANNSSVLYYQTVTCYEVTYNANDATDGSIPAISGTKYASGATVPVATNSPGALERTGYSFAGWNTEADGSGTTYAADGSASFTISDDITLYAKWTAVDLTFNPGSGTDWGTAANWSPACVPTIEHNVIIKKPVIVSETHAKAKSIVIDQNSNTGKLTIKANRSLEVAGMISKTTDGSNRIATTAEDLVLESSNETGYQGNASLIFDNTKGCAATVQMYAKGTITDGGVDDDDWNWQYIGIPFTTMSAIQYYGAYLGYWDDSDHEWKELGNGATMTQFVGYLLTQTSATTYVLDGTLTPTSTMNISVAAGQCKVIGNSWTAPIQIKQLADADFGSMEKTVYKFYTGNDKDKDHGTGTSAGTYKAISIHASPYVGDSVISSLQGFYVENKAGTAQTLALSYAKHVRPSRTSDDILNGAMYAPKRKMEERPTVLRVKASGSRYCDEVIFLERGDFDTKYDAGWDGKNINEPGGVGPFIYTLREDGTKDAVSAIPTLEGAIVGFKAGEDNTYTFSFTYDGEEEWYLNDTKENKSTLINEEKTYTFTPATSDKEARFIISKIALAPTGIEDVVNGTNARKQMIDGTLYIIRDGKIYDVLGKTIK